MSGYEQWCAGKCLTTGSAKKKKKGKKKKKKRKEKDLNCNICQFLWCKDFHCGQFQAATVMSLIMELEGYAQSALVSWYEPAPAHRWIQEER